MRSSILFAAITLFATSAALADGYMPVAQHDSCCDVNWNGVYGRASVGYNFSSLDLNSSRTEGGVLLGTVDDGASMNGAQGILTLGYDHALGPSIVVGIFGDYAFGHHDDQAAVFDPGLPGSTDSVTLKLDNTWAVGGRVGYIGTCCAMFYLSAGYTGTHMSFDDPDRPAFADGFGYEERNRYGYFLGAGVDYSLHSGLFLNLDYRFSDYGSQNLVDVDFDCGVPCNVTIDANDIQVHSLRLGLAYKFGFDRHEPVPLK